MGTPRSCAVRTGSPKTTNGLTSWRRWYVFSGLHKRTFDRRFRTATGYSPLSYIHALRVEEAKQLLETTAIPIEAVARDVGYEDTTSFRRLFRRLVGMTPGNYRRKFQLPKDVSRLSRAIPCLVQIGLVLGS